MRELLHFPKDRTPQLLLVHLLFVITVSAAVSSSARTHRIRTWPLPWRGGDVNIFGHAPELCYRFRQGAQGVHLCRAVRDPDEYNILCSMHTQKIVRPPPSTLKKRIIDMN